MSVRFVITGCIPLAHPRLLVTQPAANTFTSPNDPINVLVNCAENAGLLAFEIESQSPVRNAVPFPFPPRE
jgi:hypothetical protein